VPRRPAGPARVLIGDGRSDFCAAQWADLVFARDALREHCAAERIPCIPFESFAAVQAVLEEILTPAARAAS
jgi:2-hydroxy-3-keto-5-methylthiopentenyl-1-phosphate phosphatase